MIALGLYLASRCVAVGADVVELTSQLTADAVTVGGELASDGCRYVAGKLYLCAARIAGTGAKS